MVTWSKKAEEDYRKKYPHRENARLAGTPVKWEGRNIVRGGSIYTAYQMRGWLVDDDTSSVKMQDVNVLTGRFNGGQSTEEDRANRWKMMIHLVKQEHIKSLGQLCKRMGFLNTDSLSYFCRKYGDGLAEKYGKLPTIKSLVGREEWRNMMEA